MEVFSQIPSALDAAALYEHFADQLAAQFWTQSNELDLSSGGYALGEWVKTDEAGKLLFGVLKVERGDPDLFNLFFFNKHVERPLHSRR